VCPAGALPELEAAVDNGADAAYCGSCDATNARNFAGLNFDAAPLAAFLQMLAPQQDPDMLFFHRRLAIEGDTELGLVVKNLLDRIDWDEAMRALTGRRA
jgi:hypothetical protein